MHSKYTNQQEEIALIEFERTGSISATIQKVEIFLTKNPISMV